MKKTILSVLVLLCVVMLCVSAGKKNVTLFMVGDSTMADKEELDASPERGWGQLFPTYLTGNIVVQNHARNGRSTKSFIEQGRWDEVMKRVKRGDIVLIQFGHNDAKQSDPERYTPIADYEDNLMKMVTDAQKKHAHVILATPISRRYFKEGVFHPRHGGYPDAVRRVAKRMNVPLLDLEQSTSEWLKGLGDEQSKQYFMNVAPGECTKFPEGKTDNTHLREAGALEVGRQAAEMLKTQKIKWISKYITMDDNVVYTTPCGIQ
ncbi:MAG: rhamnogalacturonan acetylesterase [Paludibacteraceae bacterium]